MSSGFTRLKVIDRAIELDVGRAIHRAVDRKSLARLQVKAGCIEDVVNCVYAGILSVKKCVVAGPVVRCHSDGSTAVQASAMPADGSSLPIARFARSRRQGDDPHNATKRRRNENAISREGPTPRCRAAPRRFWRPGGRPLRAERDQNARRRRHGDTRRSPLDRAERRSSAWREAAWASS